MKPPPKAADRSGQAIILLLVVMVVALLAVLWNYDLHAIVSSKVRVGNAGDAAALAAARWQGITMNMVGELNLVQAAMILENPGAGIDEVSELRDRIALTGPLMGYLAAQSAAYLNLSASDERRISSYYGSRLAQRATLYMTQGGAVPEPYEGAWLDYGTLLMDIADAGMVVECANPKWFLFYDGSHILLDASFYNAVAARYWCWFELRGQGPLLEGYDGYTFWGPLPSFSQRPSVNSEFFGTDLERLESSLDVELANWSTSGSNAETTISLWNTLYEDAVQNKNIGRFTAEINAPFLFTGTYQWHFYEAQSWRMDNPWPTYDDDFPFREGWSVRPEFNYKGGADAAISTFIEAEHLTPGIHMDADSISWKAAAKPFGFLSVTNGTGNEEVRMPQYFGLVLPAFHQARLIPNDISSRPVGVSEPNWDEHIYEHLPLYIASGIDAIRGSGCWYCRQLVQWEDPEFRAAGAAWLDAHSGDCYRSSGGGGGGGGGGGASDRR